MNWTVFRKATNRPSLPERPATGCTMFEWAKPDARLGQDFLNKALPLVESQIRKAGYRLARLLNGLFD